jgi:hypothetical protein
MSEAPAALAAALEESGRGSTARALDVVCGAVGRLLDGAAAGPAAAAPATSMGIMLAA